MLFPPLPLSPTLLPFLLPPPPSFHLLSPPVVLKPSLSFVRLSLPLPFEPPGVSLPLVCGSESPCLICRRYWSDTGNNLTIWSREHANHPLVVADDTFQWPFGNRDSYRPVELSISIVLAARLIVHQCVIPVIKARIRTHCNLTFVASGGSSVAPAGDLPHCLSKPYNLPNWARTCSSKQEAEPVYCRA